MADNKRKWEKDYEKYSTMNLDDEIKKIETEVRGIKTSQAGIKDPTSKEYKEGKENQKSKEKELNKMKALKQNMPQVKRTMDLKEKLENKLKELNAQKKEVEATKKLGEEGKKLEEDLAKLIEKENKIKEALKNPKLTDDQKKILQDELSKNALAQKDNHMKFSKNQLDLSAKLNSPLQKKDFDKEIQATKNMISKCNFIGRNLMEGKRMQEITVSLNKWDDKKFVDKTEKTKKAMENTEPAEPKAPETNKEPKDNEISDYEKGVQQSIDEEDKDLVEVSEFDQRHPRIAKIKNFFKNLGTKVKNVFVKEDQEIEETVEEKPTTAETEKEEEQKTEKKEEKQEEKTVKGEVKPVKAVEGKLTAEEIAQKKSAMMERLIVRGSLMKTQSDLDKIEKAKTDKKEKDDEER